MFSDVLKAVNFWHCLHLQASHAVPNEFQPLMQGLAKSPVSMSTRNYYDGCLGSNGSNVSSVGRQRLYVREWRRLTWLTFSLSKLRLGCKAVCSSLISDSGWFLLCQNVCQPVQFPVHSKTFSPADTSDVSRRYSVTAKRHSNPIPGSWTQLPGLKGGLTNRKNRRD